MLSRIIDFGVDLLFSVLLPAGLDMNYTMYHGAQC